MGLTFDAGALIGLERRRLGISKTFEYARERGIRIVVPNVVLIEWWRGRTDVREKLLESVDVEPLTDALAKIAGDAIAMVPGATSIDAAVMASAAQRGDTVYTSDPDGLKKLHGYFATVKNIVLVT